MVTPCNRRRSTKIKMDFSHYYYIHYFKIYYMNYYWGQIITFGEIYMGTVGTHPPHPQCPLYHTRSAHCTAPTIPTAPIHSVNRTAPTLPTHSTHNISHPQHQLRPRFHTHTTLSWVGSVACTQNIFHDAEDI